MVEIRAFVGNPYLLDGAVAQNQSDPAGMRFYESSSNAKASAAASGAIDTVVISYDGNQVKEINTKSYSSYSKLAGQNGSLTAEQAYLAVYDDVRSAVDAGEFRTGLEHFLLRGAKEGKFYAGVSSSQEFGAEQLYLEENPDVVDLIKSGVFRNGLEHFYIQGAAQGKFYYNKENISLNPEQLYFLTYPDAAQSVSDGFYQNGLEHYNEVGKDKGYYFFGVDAGVSSNLDSQKIKTDVNGDSISDAATLNIEGDSGPKEGLFLVTGKSEGDSVYTGSGSYHVDLGDGSNVLFLNDLNANITVKSGSGNDRVDFSETTQNFTGSIVADLGDGTNYLNLHSQTGSATVTSGSGSDEVYVGNGNHNFIDAGDGNNIVKTEYHEYYYHLGLTSSDDFVRTGSGDDTIYTGGGNDTISAGAGNDTISVAGAQDLTLVYTGGNDTVDGAIEHLHLAVDPSATLDVSSGYLVVTLANGDTLTVNGISDLAKVSVNDARALAALQNPSLPSAGQIIGNPQNTYDGIVRIDEDGSIGQTGNVSTIIHGPAAVTVNGLDHEKGQTTLTIEQKYLSDNAAAARAVKAGKYKSGLEYFLRVGFASGPAYGMLNQQKLNSAGTAERAYLIRNLDVAEQVAVGSLDSGLQYYLQAGYNESSRGSYGRLNSNTYNPVTNLIGFSYLRDHVDQAQLVANGKEKTAIDAFFSSGISKGYTYGDFSATKLASSPNELAYLTAHTNVAQAVANGRYKSGLDYFLRAGFNQGQSYGNLTKALLDGFGTAERSYLSRNLDIGAQVASGAIASGLDYYLATGYAETARGNYGGLTTNTYNPVNSPNGFSYLQNHSDEALLVATGKAKSAAAAFLMSGINKGYSLGAFSADALSNNPNELAYLTAHTNVAQAVVDGRYKSGLDYFLRSGFNQGHTYGALTKASLEAFGSAERSYLIRNLDIAEQVSSGALGSGLEYYLSNGHTEVARGNYGGLNGYTYNSLTNSVGFAYLQQHADQALLVATGKAKSAVQAFLISGLSKGYSYGLLSLDAGGTEFDYVSAHTNVAQLVAEGRYKSGLDYFLNVGTDRGDSYGAIKSKQLGSKTSSERQYLIAYQDAAKLVADGVYVSGLDHYLALDRNEGYKYKGQL